MPKTPSTCPMHPTSISLCKKETVGSAPPPSTADFTEMWKLMKMKNVSLRSTTYKEHGFAFPFVLGETLESFCNYHLTLGLQYISDNQLLSVKREQGCGIHCANLLHSAIPNH